MSAPKPAAGVHTRRYGGGIIIGREYKETERGCRSRGARDAREQQSVRQGCEPINEFAKSKKVPT